MFIAHLGILFLQTILILNVMTKTITFNELRKVKDALQAAV